MQSRSSFVTVLAWIFIVGTGFASIASVMQAIMVSLMFSGEEFQAIPEDAPESAKFMVQHMKLLTYSFGALTLFTFVASIGLLKRKNWARLAFLVILSVGVIWQIGGLVLQFGVLDAVQEFPPVESGDEFENFDQMMEMMLWVTSAMAIGISIAFLWIIKKLATAPIADEFTRNNGQSTGEDQ